MEVFLSLGAYRVRRGRLSRRQRAVVRRHVKQAENTPANTELALAA